MNKIAKLVLTNVWLSMTAMLQRIFIHPTVIRAVEVRMCFYIKDIIVKTEVKKENNIKWHIIFPIGIASFVVAISLDFLVFGFWLYFFFVEITKFRIVGFWFPNQSLEIRISLLVYKRMIGWKLNKSTGRAAPQVACATARAPARSILAGRAYVCVCESAAMLNLSDNGQC